MKSKNKPEEKKIKQQLPIQGETPAKVPFLITMNMVYHKHPT